MPHMLKIVSGVLSVALLSACVDETGSASGGMAGPDTACLNAVKAETGNYDAAVLSSSFSQAGTEVIVGVGPQRARWQCIAYSDGSTSRPMSLTNEGFL